MWLVRHCVTEWNRVGIKFGRLDPPLDIEGLNDATELAKRFDNEVVNRVISSPLQRAAQTAEAIAHRRGLTVEIDEGLIEASHGRAEGLHELSRAVLFPSMVGVREADSLIRWRALRALECADDATVVVTHKGVLRALRVPGVLDHGSIHRFDNRFLNGSTIGS